MSILITLVQIIAWILTLLILAEVALPIFMPASHPVRVWVHKIVDPMLAPIRRILPPIQRMDFSPLILVVVISIVEYILLGLLIR
jgi:YggT family protein